MTFKHVKFEDSSTMRSLERVARDKGWLKEEPITKVASFEENDLSATGNLTENILKLCTGLRSSGMDKYADELEKKFMSYKKAQTLYDVSGEKGEDLVDAAHPKGSHKLEGVNSKEAVIETIIDKHLAHVKMVEKKPTGKLSSASQILNAVKTVLADGKTIKIAKDVANITQHLNNVLANMKSIFDIVHANKNTGHFIYGDQDLLNLIAQAINKAGDPSILTLIPKIKIGIGKFYSNFEPGFFTGRGMFNVIDDKVWEEVKPKFAAARGSLAEAQKLAEVPGEAKPVAGEADKLDKWIANATSVLRGFQSKINTDPDLSDADKKQAGAWIAKKQNLLDAISNQWKEITEPVEREQQAPGLLRNLTRITTPSFAQFKKEWID